MMRFQEMLAAVKRGLSISLDDKMRLPPDERDAISAAVGQRKRTTTPPSPTTTTSEPPMSANSNLPPAELLAMPGGARLHAEWAAASPERRKRYAAAFEQLKTEAEARGYERGQERGRAAFRARFRSIMESDGAQGRPRLAQSLALETTVDVDEARRLLAAAPIEGDHASDPTGFHALCRRTGVTLPGNGTDYGDEDADTIAARIAGATRRSNGSGE